MDNLQHPYFQTHFVLQDGRLLFKGCRAQAIVVTDDPRHVTCPTCQTNLARLEGLLALLEEADTDAGPGEEVP